MLHVLVPRCTPLRAPNAHALHTPKKPTPSQRLSQQVLPSIEIKLIARLVVERFLLTRARPNAAPTASPG